MNISIQNSRPDISQTLNGTELSVNPMGRLYRGLEDNPFEECQYLFEDMEIKHSSLMGGGMDEGQLPSETALEVANEIIDMARLYQDFGCDDVLSELGFEGNEEKVKGMVADATATLGKKASTVRGLPPQAQAALDGALDALSNAGSLALSAVLGIAGFFVNFIAQWAAQSSDASPPPNQQESVRRA
jgi:hypothetical protein